MAALITLFPSESRVKRSPNEAHIGLPLSAPHALHHSEGVTIAGAFVAGLASVPQAVICSARPTAAGDHSVRPNYVLFTFG